MAHFIPTHSTASAEEFATLFLKEIFRLHGLPKDIVSDRGSVFISRFWTTLTSLLSIKRNLSTSFHPQTDGQTERTNQTLEHFLRTYTNHHQDNWVDILPIAEFTYNNSLHSSTKTTPFFANYSFHPNLSFSNSSSPDLFTPAIDYSKSLQSIHSSLKSNLAKSNEALKKFYDKKTIPPPDFKINDLVWLSSKFINTTRPSKKLDLKRLGPFKILEKIGSSAFRLELLPEMKIHNVFHISLLDPHHANNIPNRTQPPPPPITIEGQPEWEIEQILDSRIHGGALQYKIHWKGYDRSHASWEPPSNLSNSQESIKQFHLQNPNRPSLRKPNDLPAPKSSTNHRYNTRTHQN